MQLPPHRCTAVGSYLHALWQVLKCGAGPADSAFKPGTDLRDFETGFTIGPRMTGASVIKAAHLESVSTLSLHLYLC